MAKKKTSDDKEAKKKSADETSDTKDETSDKTEKSGKGSEIDKLEKEKAGILNELTGLRKEKKELIEEKEKAAEAELKKKKKYKELAEKRNEKLTNLNQELETERKKNSFVAKAAEKGVVDLDAAFVLANKDEIEVSKDGEVDSTSVDKVVEQLEKDKPYLFGESSKRTGSPSNPPDESDEGKRTYKRSELENSKFFSENREDILKAQEEGRIIDDRSGN